VSEEETDIFEKYLNYTKDTEPPRLFHRWSLLVSIGALLSRNIYIRHGHNRIYPNLYCMFIGESGTRKSTAIKMCKRLVAATGYDNFAAEKTSKEKFLIDLSGRVEDPGLLEGKKRKLNGHDVTLESLWGENYDKTPREVFIVADEYNEFAGSSNHELHTTLGNLWDWDDDNIPFSNSFKSGSVQIWQPTVSILSGNTQEGFSRAFPPDTVGQGFLSRMLLIHGVKSGRRIAFPTSPDDKETEDIIRTLINIRSRNVSGNIEISEEARRALEDIYNNWRDLPDIRLVSYSTRRFTQLLKIILIISAARFKHIIGLHEVIYANTILSAAESNMPRALGEFGKAKNSDITNKIVTLLEAAKKPYTTQEIWKAIGVSNLDKPAALTELLQGLVTAERIQWINVGTVKGWLCKKAVNGKNEYVDWNLLTDEEKDYVR
jgi:hypothetical protein